MRIALVVAILGTLCGSGVFAESQQLPPTPQTNQTQQTPAKKKQEIYSSADTTIKITSAQIDQKQPNELNTDKPDKSLNDLLIVWFTGALAVFALCQVIAMVLQYRVMRVQACSLRDSVEVTEKAANAAELSARAAIGIELPIIRAITADMVSTDKLIGDAEPYGGIVNDGPPTKYSAIGCIRFENHGRTPAFPEKISVGWKFAEKLPETPQYITTTNLNHAEVIKPGESFTTDTHYGIELTDEELKMTISNRSWLWFYGCLFYTDFMNTKREARFCWRFANRNFDNIFYYFSSDGELPKAYTQNT